ncbi:MAG: LiaI-LiaF-like domain-containing protein [Patescibacteria group bacterium]
MPKKIFWPAALVTMGLIYLASNLGYIPTTFWNLWPIILIVVGLGGLVTSDREEWMVDTSKKVKTSPAPKKKTVVKSKKVRK